MDDQRFTIIAYTIQRNEYFTVFDKHTGKPIHNLPGASSRADYEDLCNLLNELHNKNKDQS